MSEFRCIEVQRTNGVISHSFSSRSLRRCNDGEVLVKSLYTSINYKDHLVLQGNPSLVRRFPRIPGTDVAGIVVDSNNSDISVGSYVLCVCFPLGASIDGGFSEFVYVPQNWLTVLPTKEYLYQSIMLGTAGFTAILAFEKYLSLINSDNADIIISGPNSRFCFFLSQFLSEYSNSITFVGSSLHYDTPHPYISADKFIKNERMNLLPAKYHSGFDTYGGDVLSAMLKSIHPQGSLFSVGNSKESHISTSILPLILRGVSLIGINAEISSSLTCTSFWTDAIDRLWSPYFNLQFETVSLSQFYNLICGSGIGHLSPIAQSSFSKRLLISFDG